MLDLSKLYGFRLVSASLSNVTKEKYEKEGLNFRDALGSKLGDKAGVKVG